MKKKNKPIPDILRIAAWKALKARGIGVTAFGDEVYERYGISTSTVTRWFSGLRAKCETVNAVLDCLNLKVSEK